MMWKSRQDVINTLRNSKILSVTEVKFNNEFSIPFNVGSTMFYLNLIIPDSFPSQPLIVTLSPPAKHPLVNERFEVVGSPALNGATSMQCNLESIVADAIQDLKKPPPMLINRKDENSDLRRKSEPFVLKSVPITSSCAPANQNNQNPANGNHLPMPSAPSLGYIPSQSGVVSCDADPMNSNFNHSLLPFAQWLPEKVINKEESELKDILASEEEMLELQLKSPVTVQMNQQIQSVVEETEAMAQGNLNMEGMWKERSTRLATCINSLYTLASEVASLQTKLAQAIDEQSPESQYYNLQVAVLQADEECENVSRKLFSPADTVPTTLSGNSNQTQMQIRVESFIEEYKEKRKLYHLRKAKQEQFARLLILHNSNATTGSGGSSNVNSVTSSSKT